MATMWAISGNARDLGGDDLAQLTGQVEATVEVYNDADTNTQYFSPKAIQFEADGSFSVDVPQGPDYRVVIQFTGASLELKQVETDFFEVIADTELGSANFKQVELVADGTLESIATMRNEVATNAAAVGAVVASNDGIVETLVKGTGGAGPLTRAALSDWLVRKDILELFVDDYGTPQLAINAAQAAAVPAVVKFGRGTYAVATALEVTASNVTLDLGNAALTASTTGAPIKFTGTGGGHLSRVGVRGGHVDLNSASPTGVSFDYCDDVRIDGLSVRNGSTNAGAAVALTSCTGAVVRGVRADALGTGVILSASPKTSVSNCVMTSMKRDGILVYNGSHHSTISGNTVVGYNAGLEAGRAGIHAYGSDFVTVTGNTVDSDSVATTGDSPKIRFRDARDFTCTGNTCTGLSAGGITVIALGDIGSGGGHGTITGNTIRDVSITGIQTTFASPGTAANVFPVTVTGNHIKGVRFKGSNDGTGIQIGAGTDSAVIAANYLEDLDGVGISTEGVPCSIVGNVIRQCGRNALGSRVGIMVWSNATAVVVGNYAFDDAGAPTMVNGLRVFSGSTARVSGNLFLNATSAAFRNDGTVEAQVGGIASAKVGFFGTAPIVKTSAYTQTYSTASRTHAAPTAAAVATTAATQTTPYGFTTQAQADALVAEHNKLVTDLANTKQLLNSVIDDLQAYGLLQ